MIIYVHVPLAANDNALAEARALTCEDVDTIVEENKFVLAQALDNAAAYKDYIVEPRKAAALVLQHMPDLQRAIVWRGSWLKKPAVDALSENDGSLLKACLEVIQATLSTYEAGSVEDFVLSKLAPISSYLREGKA